MSNTMDKIDILVDEHKNVLRLTDVFRAASCNILEGGEVVTDDFRGMINFARNYADKYHHGKEEKILFRIMIEELGTIAEKLIKHGMLVEHDLGRYHLGRLEAALEAYDTNPSILNKLDIVQNATGWADLLVRHAEKEDAVVYSFARRSLSAEAYAKVEKETIEFENENATAAAALVFELDALEKKYNIEKYK